MAASLELGGSQATVIAATEAQRLAAVQRYDVLDTPPDGAFERVTALAARLFDVPIAIVSIVDRDRIWFKSHHGLDVQEIGRDSGLCASAILQGEPWVVTDAAADPRTLANPLVAGALGLRFYLGVPLSTADGHNLGTLCVMDKKPRTVSDKDIATLSDLAAMVVDELELRRAARRTVEMEQQLRHQAEVFSTALQTSLLPPCLPTIPGASIAALFRPAGGALVGGDFYDLFPVSATSWGVVIGDVCGEGPVAASRSNLARYSLRGAAVHGDSPAQTLHRVNQALLAGDQLDEDSFCTLVFVLIDACERGLQVRLAVGGHPLPTLLRHDGSVTAVGRSGSIVGSFPDTEFHDDEVVVEPGDTLVLVTDGLVEIHTDHGVTGRSEFERRLAACAGLPPAALIDRLAGAMNVNDDDAAIIAFQTT